MSRPPSQWFRCLLVAFVLVPVWALGEDESPSDYFEKHVRPVLAAKCQKCHGMDKPKGDLALTSRDSILTGGKSGAAAEPGKPEESLLVEAIRYESEPRMPPKERLTDAEIAALTRWVEMGLPWPDAGPSTRRPTASEEERPTHWAFQPVSTPTPPSTHDATWARNPIDQFILARLEKEGLRPSPRADRRALARRVTFDLTGLPPTAEEVAAFLEDDRPDGYERLVDRLLASPHHGEQWARHWLDVARYSDTKGYVYAREESRWVHAWAYRDWVVRALNEDLPYDRFLLLQLAADQVSESPESLPAMGFLTLGRRFLGVTHDIIDDRIDVVTRGALGLTVACARCHDHKYDPIPTRDYYSLYGVFANCFERVAPAFAGAVPEGAFASGLRERQAKLAARLGDERNAAADRVRRRVGEYLLAQFELHKYPEEGFDQVLVAEDLFPTFVRRWRDALARAGKGGGPIFKAWHDLVGLPEDEFESRSIEVCRALQQAPSSVVNPLIAHAFAEPPPNRRAVAERYGAVFREVIDAWETAICAAECAGEAPPRSLGDADAEAIRHWLYGPDSPCVVPDEPIVSTELYFPTSVCEAIWKLQGDVDRWIIQSADSPPYATLLVDRSTSVEPRVFRRGDPSKLGEEVPRRSLEVLAGPNAPSFEHGSGRLDLARAIIDPSNPLTARVAVNRVWMHHFGSGLVLTPGDFGTRADPPSHPELLDWLATRFVAEGWSIKDLHRLIVTSATYQQAATGPSDPRTHAAALERDPENRWLWRMRPHRLTFEELRDALLAATGELKHPIGGKAVPLHKPPYRTRRTLYGYIDREDFPSLLRAFDVANPDLLIPQRNETTVPQQALYLMNNPFVLERARALVSRLESIGTADPTAKAQALYRWLFQRAPSSRELEGALELVRAAEGEPAPVVPATVADWHYGVGRLDEETGKVVGFQALPHYTGSAWQGGPSWPDRALGWAQLTAEGGHAGNDKAHAVVRRWVAPRDLMVMVRSTLTHDVEAGDGIRGALSTSRAGLLKKADAHNTSVEFHAGPLEVRAGDSIDFVVDLRDNLNNDQFRWASDVSETSSSGGTTWNARSDFSGPEVHRLGPWGQLAQVLLMANEFTFVD